MITSWQTQTSWREGWYSCSWTSVLLCCQSTRCLWSTEASKLSEIKTVSQQRPYGSVKQVPAQLPNSHQLTLQSFAQPSKPNQAIRPIVSPSQPYQPTRSSLAQPSKLNISVTSRSKPNLAVRPSTSPSKPYPPGMSSSDQPSKTNLAVRPSTSSSKPYQLERSSSAQPSKPNRYVQPSTLPSKPYQPVRSSSAQPSKSNLAVRSSTSPSKPYPPEWSSSAQPSKPDRYVQPSTLPSKPYQPVRSSSAQPSKSNLAVRPSTSSSKPYQPERSSSAQSSKPNPSVRPSTSPSKPYPPEMSSSVQPSTSSGQPPRPNRSVRPSFAKPARTRNPAKWTSAKIAREEEARKKLADMITKFTGNETAKRTALRPVEYPKQISTKGQDVPSDPILKLSCSPMSEAEPPKPQLTVRPSSPSPPRSTDMRVPSLKRKRTAHVPSKKFKEIKARLQYMTEETTQQPKSISTDSGHIGADCSLNTQRANVDENVSIKPQHLAKKPKLDCTDAVTGKVPDDVSGGNNGIIVPLDSSNLSAIISDVCRKAIIESQVTVLKEQSMCDPDKTESTKGRKRKRIPLPHPSFFRFPPPMTSVSTPPANL